MKLRKWDSPTRVDQGMLAIGVTQVYNQCQVEPLCPRAGGSFASKVVTVTLALDETLTRAEYLALSDESCCAILREEFDHRRVPANGSGDRGEDQ